MLHRVLASLLCVLGVAAAALGIASATTWRADDVLVAEAVAADGTTMIVTDPGVLDLAADQVTVTATVPRGDVVIALGRSADVDAWVGSDPYSRVTGFSTWHVLATDEVTPDEAADDATDPTAPPTTEPTSTPAAEGEPAATAAPTDAAAAGGTDTTDTAAAAPNPAGSDLWVREAGGTGHTTMEWTRTDGRWSVLVAATDAGVTPRVSLAWPQVVTTPWLVPGTVGGGLLLVIGLTWWVLLLVASHRRPARARAAAPPVVVLDPAAPVTRRQLRELEQQRQHRPEPAAPRTAPEPAGSRVETRRRGSHAKETPPEQPTSTPSPTPANPSRAAGSPMGGRFGRRRQEASVPPPEVLAPPLPQVVAPRTTPAASADAWRRTWGLGVIAPDEGSDAARPDDERPEGGAR